MSSGEAIKRRGNKLRYGKWGYIFLSPFYITFFIFTFVPLITTFYYSFFEYFKKGVLYVGPNFVGIENYEYVFDSDLGKYIGNTFWMWVLGFIPQIVMALVLAAWFSNMRLKIKAQGFFKTIIYAPNMIMAASIAMLFFTILSGTGPVNQLLMEMGAIDEPIMFMQEYESKLIVIAFINFFMWYGNTTILLLAGMLGIDGSIYEAASIDGATGFQSFRKITIPMLRPIMVYVLIMSLIGGLQMYDVPTIITDKNSGNPDRKLMTIIMYLQNFLRQSNLGRGGAVAVILFAVTGVFSFLVFKTVMSGDKDNKKKKRARRGKK